jgi:hypothetical protein
MIVDILQDTVPYQRANAALRGYGGLLRTVDMQQRYGQQADDGSKKLTLIQPKA